MSDELFNVIVRPVQSIDIEYRAYYNEQGSIISMSSHNHPAGEYITITKEQYDCPNYNQQVIDGKLVDTANHFRVQLVKSNTGVPVVKGHAGLVIEPHDTYTDIEHYAHRNN